MKIEKGKLYYDGENVLKASFDTESTRWGNLSNKIAVHCPTKEDWEYVNNVIGDTWGFANKYPYRLLNDYDYRHNILQVTNNNYHIITIEEFKKFYPEPLQEAKDFIDNLPDGCIAKLGNGGDMLLTSERGKKETSNKLNYELDFDFITQMAERMQTNKGKYDPYNWKKPIEIDGLKQAIFRHVLEIMKGNYEDDGRLMGHLEALSCNAMILNYQLKK